MSRQHIALGTVANDGNGDDLRTGGDKINDNFIELYNMTQGGTCTGTKYSQLRAAVKYCWLTPLQYNYLYYISKVIAGAVENGFRLYTVEISRTISPIISGTLVGEHTYHVPIGNIKNDTQVHAITSAIFGGITGMLVIDWSKLTTGQTYTCSTWLEGSLMAICTQSGTFSAAGGGGTGIDPNPITIIDNSTNVDGCESILLLDPPNEDMLIQIVNIEDVVGPIMLKNISQFPVTIRSEEGLPIDGYNAIKIEANQVVTIIPNVDSFVVLGTYAEGLEESMSA